MTNSPILLALSETSMTQLMSRDLTMAGYTVEVMTAPEQLVNAVKEHPSGLLVLDSGFNQGRGLSLCKSLRIQEHALPILLILSSDSVENRVACLQAGADDYFARPYRSENFLQIIHTYLQVDNSKEGDYLSFDNLVLDLNSRTALRGGRLITFTSKEFELLRYLMEHPQEVLTREQILENVWGYDFGGESNVIEVYIRYLRLKIEKDSENKLIHTVRGVGYVLRDS